jgi:hypothetical protein
MGYNRQLTRPTFIGRLRGARRMYVHQMFFDE